jgi:hypothetical protein
MISLNLNTTDILYVALFVVFDILFVMWVMWALCNLRSSKKHSEYLDNNNESLLSKQMDLVKRVVSSTPPSQQSFYHQKGAKPQIQEIVSLSNKRRGMVAKTMLLKITNCKKNKKRGWDLEWTNNSYINHIAVKSSCYWRSGNKYFFRWQHILPDLEWSHLILLAFDFTEIKLFFMSKPKFMKLICEGYITQQGGASGQGFWMKLDNIKTHIDEITGENLNELKSKIRALLIENPASYSPISAEEIKSSIEKGKGNNEDDNCNDHH